jgi:superfamily I DNA/RNA helicase
MLMLMLLWKYLVLTGKRNKVSVISMHQSKGLEWPVVFLTNLNEENRLVGDQEEEKRLFYVAVTRAKEKLYLSFFGRPNENLFSLIQANQDLIEFPERDSDGVEETEGEGLN